MAETSIEWAHFTFNPWIGCTKVSPACDNCYAENWGRRFGVKWGHGEPRRLTSEANWQKPRQWNAKAEGAEVRPRVFCASLADVFDTEVPDEWRLRLMDLIKQTPNLDWLLLTKRPNVMAQWARDFVWPGNAWAGTTVENQAMADLRIPKLLEVPAPVRFLSMEPLLGPVELAMYFDPESICCGGDESCYGNGRCPASNWPRDGDGNFIRPDWVIAGGESGPNARPMHPDWARSLRDQCQAAGVPFLFKQYGEWAPARLEHSEGAVNKTGGRYHYEFDPACGSSLKRLGKKAAGRLLDGREHNEFPHNPMVNQ